MVGYHSFRVKAKLQEGTLNYAEMVLRGQPMTITAAGKQDIEKGEIDMNLLAALLVTVDRMFMHLPRVEGNDEGFGRPAD